jgi:potassium-dependent mechanosensitive channel
VLSCVVAISITGCLPSGSSLPAGGTSAPAPPDQSAAAGPGSAPAKQQQAAPQDTTEPGAIPFHLVPRASESLLSYFGEVGGQLVATAVVDDVRSDLPAIDAALATLDSQRIKPESDGTRRGDINDRRQEYLRLDERLAGIETRLEKRADEVASRIVEWDGFAELWSRTDAQADAQGAPDEIRDRIAQVRARIDQAGEQIRSGQAALLGLLVEVSGRRITVAAAVRDLDAFLKSEQDRLFKVESAPLTTALRHPPHQVGLFGEALEAWRDNGRAFSRFGAESRGRLLVQAAFLGALLVLFTMLGPVVGRRAKEDDSLALAAWILGRPISAAVLIALIGTFWIHPLAPRSVFRAATLLMVAPILRLLPGLMPQRFYKPIRALAVLYVFDRSIAFASPHSLLLRVLMMVVAAATAIALLWQLRPAGVLGRIEGRGGAWGRLAGWVALLLLGTSVVANFAGNVSLAALLGRGVLLGTYAGIAFYAAARILESLWIALLSTPGARDLRVVSSHGALLRERGSRLVGLVAVLIWSSAVLHIFGLWDPLFAGLASLLATPWTLGDVTVSFGSIILFLATVAVAVLLARLIRFALDEAVLPPLSLPRGVPTAISVSTQYVVLGTGLVLAISASGVAMDRFTFLVGALGVGIGFGLQNIVNNFVSGLILLYERPVQVGDIVEVGSLLGDVRRIGVRSSTVRTYDGAEVIVPNASLISQEVVNWTLSDRTRRIEIPLGVVYGTDPDRVLQLLIAAVKDRHGVLQAPQPVALFQGFGDSSLDFVVRFWTAEFDRWSQVSSDARAAIYQAVRAAGIEIPFPQRDLHLRTGTIEARPEA